MEPMTEFNLSEIEKKFRQQYGNGLPPEFYELTREIRKLRDEVSRLRAHVGWLTGDDKQAIALGIVPEAEMARRQRDAFSDVGYMGQYGLAGRKNKPG